MRGRRIAFDYGDVRTGVAISDPDAILASPLCTLATQSKGFFSDIEALLTDHQPIRIFIGKPINMSGTSGPSAEKVMKFAEGLSLITSLPIQLIDERLSTVSAQKKLKEAGLTLAQSKDFIDAMAAVAILEQGLNSED
jgi:putative Holliday junction resolvase